MVLILYIHPKIKVTNAKSQLTDAHILQFAALVRFNDNLNPNPNNHFEVVKPGQTSPQYTHALTMVVYNTINTQLYCTHRAVTVYGFG